MNQAAFAVETEEARVSGIELVPRNVLSLTLAYLQNEDDGTVGVLGKLLVNGRQIGLITYLEVKLHANEVFPDVLVHVCGGLPEEAKASCPGLRSRALECIAELKKFPFVRIESPFLTE